MSRCARGLLSPSRIGVLTVRAQNWQAVFHHFDQNKNGVIDGDEMKVALERFGYHLSSQLVWLLRRKYGAGLSLSIQSLLCVAHACST